jgi:hypothetical protein
MPDAFQRYLAQTVERLSTRWTDNRLVIWALSLRPLACTRHAVSLRLISPAAEFVVEGGGEHVDAGILDGDGVGPEYASGNRNALVR